MLFAASFQRYFKYIYKRRFGSCKKSSLLKAFDAKNLTDGTKREKREKGKAIPDYGAASVNKRQHLLYQR